MRPDQLQRIQDLSERLADAFIEEADPAEWPAAGIRLADISTQERGDRYWCKKNAAATAGVLRFALDLIERRGPEDPANPAGDDELERKILDAEARASREVDRVLKRAKAPADGR